MAACDKDEANKQNMDVIKIAVLPDQSKKRLSRRYASLIKYLSEETGIPCKLILVENYSDLVSRFAKKEIDFARFGGVTFVQTHFKYDAVPLVMRDVDAKFTSYFIVHKSASEKTVMDYKGKSLSFGSQLSTSGHLMPRFYLSELGISEPEKHFSEIHYSGAHDATINSVKNGEVDIGAVNSVVLDELYRENKDFKNSIRILWKTPPYADYVWATQNTLPNDIQQKVLNAFLKLDLARDEHKGILEKVGAGGYLPARIQDFKVLTKIVEKQGLLR